MVYLRNGTLELCQGNLQCIFDFQLTGNEGIAKSTKQFNDRFESVIKEIAPGNSKCMHCYFWLYRCALYKHHLPLTQQSWIGLAMLSRHSMGTGQGKGLTCNSSGKIHPQSSGVAEPLWTDLWLKREEMMHAS